GAALCAGPPPVVTVLPLAQVDVQTEAQVVARAGVVGRRSGIGIADHEGRAGDDAVLERFHDAGVDPGGAAEVVGVDDEAPRHAISPRRVAAAAASASQSR